MALNLDRMVLSTKEDKKFLLTSEDEVAVRVVIAEKQGLDAIESFYYVNQPISALKIVRAIDKDTIELADITANDFELSRGFAITLQGGPSGSKVKVCTFGKVQDAFFNFPNGVNLFLAPNGEITTTPPPTGFLLNIGHSMGAGAIFINFKDIINRR